MGGTLSGTEYVDLVIAPGEYQDITGLTLANGVVLLDSGTLTQDGNFALGQTTTDTATLSISTGGVFELVNDTQIAADGQALIVNSGLFEKLGISQYGDSLIDPSFTNTSTGTIDAATGLIGLQGGGVLDGTLTGAGEINLGDAADGETALYTLAASAVVSAATLAVEGDGFSGVSGLVLAGGARTFTDALQLGGDSVLEGGTMVIAGSAVINNFIIADAGTIVDTGTIVEDLGGLQLGQAGTDSGSLIIAAGGVFDAVNDQGDGIGTDGSGPSTLLNEGLFINTSTDHVAVIGMSMTNAATGTIAIIAGGIDAADVGYPVASLVNDGLITISHGALTVGLFYNALGSVGADPGATGLIEIGDGGVAAFAATVAANQVVDFTGGDAVLLLNRPAEFAAPIEHLGFGDTIDLDGISANGFSFNAGSDVLALSDTVGGIPTAVAALTLAGFSDAAALTLLNDSAGGTEIVLEPSGGTFVANGSVTTDFWTVSSGDWGDAGNWSAGAPGALDLVSFSAGGGTISFATIETIDAISDASGGAFTLDQTGGTLALLDGGVFAGGVTQGAPGVLADDGGVLALSGAVSLAGTLAGSGVIALDGYQDLDTLAAGAVLDVASLALNGGAELVLEGDASFAGDFLDGDHGTLNLNGNDLTLSGDSSFEYGAADIIGAGTIYVTGETDLDIHFAGSAVVVDAGTIVQDPPTYGSVAFPAGAGLPDLSIAQGGVYDVVNSSGFGGTIVNAGLFEQSDNNSGDVSDVGNFTNTSTGTINAQAGTELSFQGGGTFAGTLAGAGEIAFTGYGETFALDPSAAVTVATLALGGDVLLNANSYAFGQDVQLGYAFIYGPGTLALTGFSDLNGLNLGPNFFDGAELLDAGSMLDQGALNFQGYVSSNGTFYGPSELSIASGAVFNIVDPYGISGDGDIVNNGLFELSTGIGALAIQPYFTNASAGTIDVVNGTLDFAGGGIFAGTLEGAGAIAFTGGLVTFAPGVVFEAADIAFAGATITGAPVLAAPGSVLTLGAGAEVQSPTIAGGGLDLANGYSITGDIALSGTGGTLVIEADAAIPANTITGFGIGDTIELAGISFTGSGGAYGAAGEDTYTVATAGTLSIDADGDVFNLLIAGATVGEENFVLGGDLEITEAACYVAGTRISTAAGEVPVEHLEIGDDVETLHAGLQKIKWIGQHSYDGRFVAGNRGVLPICIKRNAIAENVPARDLFVSPGHAICIDGVLIHAIRLVNGVSITQADTVGRVTYYHIETASHEVIFAENCPAESFMGEAFRGRFQNAAQFRQLYPGAAATETMCLKRLDSGFQLHAIQQRIAARAGIAKPASSLPGPLRGYVDQAGPEICYGWAQDMLAPEEPVCLDITADGRTIGRVLANLYRADVQAAGYGGFYHGFEFVLPPGITGRIDAVRAADRAVLARPGDAAADAA